MITVVIIIVIINIVTVVGTIIFLNKKNIENEEKIQQALATAAKNKTVIVITHKINTIINADKIIYMENGKIEACGNHKELSETCSEYKKLWDLAN